MGEPILQAFDRSAFIRQGIEVSSPMESLTTSFPSALSRNALFFSAVVGDASIAPTSAG
jgi:hypothetical protein